MEDILTYRSCVLRTAGSLCLKLCRPAYFFRAPQLYLQVQQFYYTSISLYYPCQIATMVTRVIHMSDSGFKKFFFSLMQFSVLLLVLTVFNRELVVVGQLGLLHRQAGYRHPLRHRRLECVTTECPRRLVHFFSESQHKNVHRSRIADPYFKKE